mmetsp:Transcript_12136/g.11987  ORF Transcript_12136/g.11987 Transcript_12136/m.11987 type:complete len:96 (+) Transcript_12136:822-1109(+)
MVDKEGVLTTLIQGACMTNPTTNPPYIPFQLGLIPMLCYRKWIDSDGFFSGVEKAEAVSTTGNSTCMNEHYVNCNDPMRPLIKEQNFTQIKPKIA